MLRNKFSAYLSYDPDSGKLHWKTRPPSMFCSLHQCNAWNARHAGREAGCNGGGYVVVTVEGRTQRAHRIAAILMGESVYGVQIDHINGNGLDNRWENLRLVGAAENRKNMRLASHNTSGVMGVVWDDTRRAWQARIKLGGRTKYIGRYDDWFDAVCARKSAEVIYGFHANHGRPD